MYMHTYSSRITSHSFMEGEFIGHSEVVLNVIGPLIQFNASIHYWAIPDFSIEWVTLFCCSVKYKIDFARVTPIA